MTTVNITVENDADFYRKFQYVYASDSSPVDITGATFEMMLRRRAEDVEALLRLATDTGEIILVDPVNGFFSITIRQIDLEELGIGDYDQSLIMTLGGYKTKIWNGKLTNNAGPTR